MSSKRDMILAAIEACQQAWVMPTPKGKEEVSIVLLHADYAKALADASKLAIAMVDRAAEVSAVLEDLKEPAA